MRARALLLITAAVRSARTPLSAAGPGDPPAPPCGEGEAAATMGRGRVSAAPACRPPLFAWDALFPPAAEAPPACERPLPSADQLALLAGALKAIAQDAAGRAAGKAEALRHAGLGARGRLAPGEAPLAPASAILSAAVEVASSPPRSADGAASPASREAADSAQKAHTDADSATLSSRSLEAASRVLVRGADAAARLLSAPLPVAASPEGALLADTLRAARVAVLLENLAGSIHGKNLRAFLREEAKGASAEGEAGSAAPPAPPAAATSGPASLAAASAALASAWAKEEAPPTAGGGVEPVFWSDVSVGARLPLCGRLTPFCACASSSLPAPPPYARLPRSHPPPHFLNVSLLRPKVASGASLPSTT